MRINGPVPMGTAEELLGQVGMMLDEQASDERQARQVAREARREANEDRVGAMRTAADFQLAAGLVKGGTTAAGGAINAANVSAMDTAPRGEPNFWADGGKDIFAGSGNIGESILNYAAAQNNADATVHEGRAQIASDAAADANDGMQETRQARQKAMQHLETILQAQIDAQRAAIRG